MNVKDTVKQVVDTLPDETTLDDVTHALYVKTKFDHGMKEISSGQGVTHQNAKSRLRKWVK